MGIKFEGGINIAIKAPRSKYESTVGSYLDIENCCGSVLGPYLQRYYIARVRSCNEFN